MASALLFAGTAFVIPAHAASFTLAWNPSSSPGVAGYVIYYGTSSGTYTGKADAGLAGQYTVGNLSAGAKYFVAMASYDASRNESAHSAEITVTTLAAATPAPTAVPTPTATPAPTATPGPSATPQPTAAPSPTPTAVPTQPPVNIPGGVVVTPVPTANPTPTRRPRGTPIPTVAPTLAPTVAPTSAPASPTPVPGSAGGSVSASDPSSNSSGGGCAYLPGTAFDPVLPMTLLLATGWVGVSRRRRLGDAKTTGPQHPSPFGDR